MMVDARAFDAAKIGEEDGGKVRVILPQEVGHLAKEVQCLDDPDDKCQNRTRQLFEHVHRAIHTVVLFRAGLVNLADDPVRHLGERPVFRRGDDHEGLLAVILEAFLGYEAKGNFVALVKTSAGDEAVELRAKIYRFCDSHKNAVKKRGAVFFLALVLPCDVAKRLCHVEFHIDVDLGIRAVVHQMRQNDMERIHIADPAGVFPVAPAFLCRVAHSVSSFLSFFGPKPLKIPCAPSYAEIFG